MTDAFTCDDEIEAIARGLADRTLPKSQWTHRAHFAAALWFLARRPELDLPRVMPALIRAYNEATGVPNSDTDGYHETITQASLRAAAAFLRAHSGMPLFAVCNALMKTPLGNSGWPLGYWSKERLFSIEARRSWIEPDIHPLPPTLFLGLREVRERTVEAARPL